MEIMNADKNIQTITTITSENVQGNVCEIQVIVGLYLLKQYAYYEIWSETS